MPTYQRTGHESSTNTPAEKRTTKNKNEYSHIYTYQVYSNICGHNLVHGRSTVLVYKGTFEDLLDAHSRNLLSPGWPYFFLVALSGSQNRLFDHSGSQKWVIRPFWVPKMGYFDHYGSWKGLFGHSRSQNVLFRPFWVPKRFVSAFLGPKTFCFGLSGP